jgi:hypothetical protein
MTCDECQRKMNYGFYINAEHWRKVVGQEKFKKNIGHVCAHCTLEKLGGASWYIIWNEPRENIERQQRELSAHTTSGPRFWPPDGKERCHADNDGECHDATICPQLRDGEPAKTDRHCPLDTWDEDYESLIQLGGKDSHGNHP